MKHFVLPLVLALVLSPRAKSEPPGPADIVFVNGNVYTANDAAPKADAIATKGERIVFVGSNAEANRFYGPTTRTSLRLNMSPAASRKKTKNTINTA